MRDTAGEVRTNSYETYSSGPLHIDEQSQDDQQEPIYNSSLLIQDIDWKTSRDQWTIETDDERRSGRSVLAAWHDDDDDIYIYIYIYIYMHMETDRDRERPRTILCLMFVLYSNQYQYFFLLIHRTPIALCVKS